MNRLSEDPKAKASLSKEKYRMVSRYPGIGIACPGQHDHGPRSRCPPPSHFTFQSLFQLRRSDAVRLLGSHGADINGLRKSQNVNESFALQAAVESGTGLTKRKPNEQDPILSILYSPSNHNKHIVFNILLGFI